jgi:hypothetical protein
MPRLEKNGVGSKPVKLFALFRATNPDSRRALQGPPHPSRHELKGICAAPGGTPRHHKAERLGYHAVAVTNFTLGEMKQAGDALAEAAWGDSAEQGKSA